MDAVHFRRRPTPLNLSEMWLVPSRTTGLGVDLHIGTGYGPAGVLVAGSGYRQKDPGVWVSESTGYEATGALAAFLRANDRVLADYWNARIGFVEAERRLTLTGGLSG